MQEAELISELGLGATHVLLVGIHQDSALSEVRLIQREVELVAGVVQSGVVRGVDDEDKGLSFKVQIAPPGRSRNGLVADAPRFDGDIIEAHSFDWLAVRMPGVFEATEVQPGQNGRFAGVSEALNNDPGSCVLPVARGC